MYTTLINAICAYNVSKLIRITVLNHPIAHTSPTIQNEMHGLLQSGINSEIVKIQTLSLLVFSSQTLVTFCLRQLSTFFEKKNTHCRAVFV